MSTRAAWTAAIVIGLVIITHGWLAVVAVIAGIGYLAGKRQRPALPDNRPDEPQSLDEPQPPDTPNHTASESQETPERTGVTREHLLADARSGVRPLGNSD